MLKIARLCLFAANSGMYRGEQFNLHWRCISAQTDTHNGKAMHIAKVIAYYGTSKKRLEQREFWCRGGEYIERWAEIAESKTKTALCLVLMTKHEYQKQTLCGIGTLCLGW